MSEQSVEYDMAEAEVLQLLQHHHRVSPMSRSLRRFTIALAAAAAGLVAYVSDQAWRSLLWAGVGALLVATLYRWGGPAFNRAFWKRSLREGSGALFGRRTLTLQPDALRCVAAQFESSLKWSAIDRIEADAQCLYFMMTGGGIPIPRAAFASLEESEAFLTKARELHRLGSRADA